MADVLLLVLSEYSATDETHRALNSVVKQALVKERKGFVPMIFPIHLHKNVQKMGGSWVRLLQLAQEQGRDFTNWKDQSIYQEALQQLIRDLATW